MNIVAQLRTVHERMLQELAQLPEYRAAKAMETFIHELSAIYDKPYAAEARESEHRPASPAQAPKVTPYVPAHRVA